MKLIFFGPTHSPALELLGEISPQFSFMQISKLDELIPQLEEGELTVLVMDFDDEQQEAIYHLSQKKYPHLKRILVSSVRGAKEFREHQFSTCAADGYLRSPLDAGLIEEILHSFQSAFLADSPENVAANRSGTLDISLGTLAPTESNEESEDSGPTNNEDAELSHDGDTPPPLDPEKEKIIQETLSEHKIKLSSEDEGPPPFDNTLNRKIQGVFDSVFNRGPGPMDLTDGDQDGLEIESNMKPGGNIQPEEIEFSLESSEDNNSISIEESSENVENTNEKNEAESSEMVSEDTGISLEVADENIAGLDLAQEGEDAMANAKPSQANVENDVPEDDKQTIQLDLAQMKKELKMDQTATGMKKNKAVEKNEESEGKLEFTNSDESNEETSKPIKDKDSNHNKKAGGVELSLGAGGTGFDLELQGEQSTAIASTEEDEAILTSSEQDVSTPQEIETTTHPPEVNEELDFSANSDVDADVDGEKANKVEATASGLEFNANEEVSDNNVGEVTGELKVDSEVAEETKATQHYVIPSADDLKMEEENSSPTRMISANEVHTPQVSRTKSGVTLDSAQMAEMNKDRITQTQVSEFSINTPMVDNKEEFSPQDRPQQAFEYRAYLDHKKEHDEIVSHHGNELVRLSATIRNLREDREQLLKKMAKLEDEKTNFKIDLNNTKAELDEVKIENAIIRKKHQEEKEMLQYETEILSEKKHYYEEKIHQLQDQLNKVEQKVKLDINKVLQREKELESEIELLRSDADAQLRSREDKIVELKKKIDLLEFDMENMTSYEKKFKNSNVELEERLNRVMKTLKMAMKMLDLENDKHTPDFNENVQPLRKVK